MVWGTHPLPPAHDASSSSPPCVCIPASGATASSAVVCSVPSDAARVMLTRGLSSVPLVALALRLPSPTAVAPFASAPGGRTAPPERDST